MSKSRRERALESGAVFESKEAMVPLHYGDAEREAREAMTGVVLVDHSDRSVFELHCPEMRRWCNGMFTNNIKRLSEGRGNRNAMCDDRGRVLGLLDLYFVTEQQAVVVLDGVDREWFETHYRMYLILDDVELEPEDTEASHRIATLVGPGAESVVAMMGWAYPESDYGHVSTDDGVRICRRPRAGLPSVDLLIPPEKFESIWATLVDRGIRPAGSRAMEMIRVRAGEARWPRDGREKTLIHELGLEAQVCAFDKGCYVGQEVINRVDVKGAINKRITGMRFSTANPPPVPSPVIHDGKEIGRLTSLVAMGDVFLGLGILRKTAWEPGTAIVVIGDEEEWCGVTVSLPLQDGVG